MSIPRLLGTPLTPRQPRKRRPSSLGRTRGTTSSTWPHGSLGKICGDTSTFALTTSGPLQALTVGERSPQGYLYQGTEAYTIVEQPDGSLTLTQYALTPVEEWKQLDNPADVPLYREVSSENQMVPASVAKSLYE